MFNQKRYRSFSKSSPGFSRSRKSFSSSRRGYNPHRSMGLEAKPELFIKKAIVQTAATPPYTPHNDFSDFPLSSPLKQNIISKGYLKPTPIQDQSIMPILQERDLIGLANTGTGKTAAFLIPIIDQIFKNRDKRALIIAPTRELAVQINEEFRNFSEGMKLHSSLIIGGTNTQRQVINIRRNPHVVIGTPGRLRDLIEKRVLDLRDFSI